MLNGIAVRTSILTLATTLVFMLSACGGGGGGTTPNPGGQQQQPPGGQAQALPPDASSIDALFDDQAMAFTMTAGPGSVRPDANVVIEDPQNFTATAIADGTGAFVINQGDIPPNFMTAPGTTIRVYQFKADLLRSEAANVIVTLPNGST